MADTSTPILKISEKTKLPVIVRLCTGGYLGINVRWCQVPTVDKAYKFVSVREAVKTIRTQVGSRRMPISYAGSCKVEYADRVTAALMDFVLAVEVTGGVSAYGAGNFAPEADPDWFDIGRAYELACEALHRNMLIK